jgi:small-conductance mechanosensitive channel/CRP-like cAMP-binding protein
MMGDLDLREIVADPFVQTGLLALVGALFTHVLLRHYPTKRLIVQATFFAALTVLLLHYGIVPYEVAPADTPVVERIFLALAKIIWWVNAAWVLTACARVFLIFEQRPREGRLIQDLVIATIYLGAGLSVVAYVFSAPVGTLIATSGVFAIILGLALQSTLSDVFSGIALNLSRPYSVGDWIVLDDGMEGRVVETNWRATHLVNASNDLVVLPNSVLAKARFTNLSSPSRSHGVKLGVRVMPTMAPSAISDVMHTVLLSCNSIAPEPAPTVQIIALDGQAIEFELSFRVRDFSTAATVKHEVYDLIYRHAKAAGLALAHPRQAPAVIVGSPQAVAVQAPRNTMLRLLDAVPLFVSLTEDEKEALAATMTQRTYRKGETVVEQGAKLNSLDIIRNGVLVVSRHGHDGTEVELGRLAPGDYFGEDGLFTGSGEEGTIRALTAVVIYEVGQAALAKLMHDRPSIADEVSITLSRRTKQGQAAHGDEGRSADMRSVPRLVARIRHLFGVPQS